MANVKVISHRKKVMSRIERNIADILIVGADTVKSKTAQDTPTISGDLKGSWTASDVKDSGTKSHINVGSNLEYAARVELGFVGDDILGRTFNQEGQYMLTNAFKESKSFIKKLFKTKLLK